MSDQKPRPAKAHPVSFPLVATEPVAGAWCVHCLLPSAHEATIHRMCPEHGSHRVARVVFCLECMEWEQLDCSGA